MVMARPMTWLEHGFPSRFWPVGAVGLSSVSELGRSQCVAWTPIEPTPLGKSGHDRAVAP